MVRSSQRRTKAIAIEDVHRALPTVESLKPIIREHEKESTSKNTNTKKDGALKTLSAITSKDSSPFDNALHEYSMFARPNKEEDVKNLVEIISRIALLCGSSPEKWKIFILVACHRRYHSKAPFSKVLSKEEISNGDSSEKIEEKSKEGDGERLIFYVTALSLRRLHHLIAKSKKGKEIMSVDFLKAAIRCMVHLSPIIGGTRDVNAMIEHLCFDALRNRGHISVAESPDAPSSFKEKLLPALEAMCLLEDEDKISSKKGALALALSYSAALLDKDLEKSKTIRSKKRPLSTDDIPSTIHVTLPHHGRGCKDGKTWQRNLANCVAEILIWNQTKAAKMEDRFSQAMSELRQMAPIHAGAQDDAYDRVLKLQTTARKKRKILNDAARSQGYMLCSQYLMDKSAIAFKQICRGKAGDLAMLRKLASKSRDTKMMTMMAKRNVDPNKAPCAESVTSLVNEWKDINLKPAEDTLEAIELKIQAQTVNATIQRLKPDSALNDRPVMVAKIGRGTEETVCAILVAAALYPRSRLLVRGELRDLDNNEKIMRLLDDAVKGSLEPENSITNDAEEIVKDHLKESEDLVFISSVDVELEEDTLKNLKKNDNTIRVHSASRVKSAESATVELNSMLFNRLKANANLSVAVLLDCTGSMSSEIEGCKKGALKLIELFNTLAPVRHANFLGYWDPISSRNDPNPRSCDYVDPSDRANRANIQHFVNSQLPCTGGGDEPEDVPAALEKLIRDMKDRKLTADKGVHFVFFIADAGYRRKEKSRINRLLQELKEFNVVMVMCPVRNYGGGTLEELMTAFRNVFSPSGQYIELNEIGQLESIAATVTESIRASLFSAGNVSSVTSSIGGTIDSISQLCGFQKDHSSLKRVEDLTAEDEEKDTTEEAKEPDEKNESGMEIEEEGEEDTDVFVSSESFGLTNRDRLYLQASKLPEICHKAVNEAFGGASLQEMAAKEIAKRLMDDGIAIGALKKAGYPDSLVEVVRGMMGGHGISRSVEGKSEEGR